LDLHAGTGRRLRPLAAAGFRVTAREPDPELRAAAAPVAAVSARGLEVPEGGRIDLDDEAAHDLVLALDGALWTAIEPDARVDAARRLRRAVRPGGVLVLQGPNAFTLLPAGLDRPARTELYHRAQVSWLPQQTVDPHAGVLEQRDDFVVEVDGEEVAEWSEHRRLALLGRPQLAHALRQAGWDAVETFRDLRATAVGRALGRDLVMVARAGA
ncbi:MAG: methyltransferase domain-containing protein, partial [Myxococcales bacterium]|nr:methyltransferase domain-containing protein [Myxococcales bacterium]